MDDVTVRPIQATDMVVLHDIEAEAFEFPWAEKDFIRCLKRRNCQGFIATKNEIGLGYVIMETCKDYIQLINLAIRNKYRRKGVGSKLLQHVANQLTPTNKKKIILEIRETNLVAQLFFQSCKYRATEVIRSKYDDTNEDAFRLEYRVHWPSKSTKNDKAGYFMHKKELEV